MRNNSSRGELSERGACFLPPGANLLPPGRISAAGGESLAARGVLFDPRDAPVRKGRITCPLGAPFGLGHAPRVWGAPAPQKTRPRRSGRTPTVKAHPAARGCAPNDKKCAPFRAGRACKNLAPRARGTSFIGASFSAGKPGFWQKRPFDQKRLSGCGAGGITSNKPFWTAGYDRNRVAACPYTLPSLFSMGAGLQLSLGCDVHTSV